MSFHHQQVSPQITSAWQNADEAKIAITYGFLRFCPLENKTHFKTRLISSSRKLEAKGTKLDKLRRTTWHGISAGGEWGSCQRHDGAGASGAVRGAVESSQRSTDWPDRADPGELPPSWPLRAWTTNCSRHVLTRDEHYCRSILRSMSMPNTARQPAGHVFRRRRCSLICRRSFQMWRQT